MATLNTHTRHETVQRDLEGIRSLTLCKVCLRPFYEPFILICGHSFCYGCLRSWFCGDANRKKHKNCPECRTVIQSTPAPNFALRDLAHMFLDRQDLLPEDETIAEHKKGREEEADLLSTDKQSHGLFQGIFSKFEVPSGTRIIHDIEDGVVRCPLCNWEMEDEAMCNRCGWEDPEYDFSDIDQDSMADMESEDDDSMDDGTRYAIESDLEGAGHDGMPRFYDIRSDADDTTAGTDGYGTPRPYSYGEDDEDDMGDFISDDEDRPSETDFDTHGWGGQMSHNHFRNHAIDLDAHGFSEPDYEPTSDVSEATHRDETNTISSHSSSDEEDENVIQGRRFNRVLSDEEEEEEEEEEDAPIVTGIRNIQRTSPQRPGFTHQHAESDNDADQHTNYDESDSEEPVNTAISAHRNGPKRRPHLIISDDDDDDDGEPTEGNNEDVTSTSESSTVSDDRQGQDLAMNQEDESNDSDDSTPPQTAAQRMRRLGVHQAARARRSTPDQDRATNNRFNRISTTSRPARQAESVSAANRSRARPFRPSTRVH